MENLLEHLNQVNDVPVYSVLDPEFAPYGRVVTGYDLSEMIAYMEQNTSIPENGNVHVASVAGDGSSGPAATGPAEEVLRRYAH